MASRQRRSISQWWSPWCPGALRGLNLTRSGTFFFLSGHNHCNVTSSFQDPKHLQSPFCHVYSQVLRVRSPLGSSTQPNIVKSASCLPNSVFPSMDTQLDYISCSFLKTGGAIWLRSLQRNVSRVLCSFHTRLARTSYACFFCSFFILRTWEDVWSLGNHWPENPSWTVKFN